MCFWQKKNVFLNQFGILWWQKSFVDDEASPNFPLTIMGKLACNTNLESLSLNHFKQLQRCFTVKPQEMFCGLHPSFHQHGAD